MWFIASSSLNHSIFPLGTQCFFFLGNFFWGMLTVLIGSIWLTCIFSKILSYAWSTPGDRKIMKILWPVHYVSSVTRHQCNFYLAHKNAYTCSIPLFRVHYTLKSQSHQTVCYSSIQIQNTYIYAVLLFVCCFPFPFIGPKSRKSYSWNQEAAVRYCQEGCTRSKYISLAELTT